MKIKIKVTHLILYDSEVYFELFLYLWWVFAIVLGQNRNDKNNLLKKFVLQFKRKLAGENVCLNPYDFKHFECYNLTLERLLNKRFHGENIYFRNKWLECVITFNISSSGGRTWLLDAILNSQ